jgi:putative membrane protein
MARYQWTLVAILSSALAGACGDDDTQQTADNTGASTRVDGGSTSDGGGRTPADSSATRPGTAENAGSNSSTLAGRGSASPGGSISGPDGSAVTLSDEEIASVALTANMGEVQQNMIALMRAQSADARNYAQDMVDMHSAALERETALATSIMLTPADNPIAVMLRSDSDRVVETLQSAPADEFDPIYLRSQVDVHQNVLNLIETVLQPSAQAEPLKQELTLMRETVSAHLERARGLAGGSTGESGASD